MSTPSTLSTGAIHPLVASREAPAWEFHRDLFAWVVDGDVVIQGDDGDVTIPARRLPALARALLAVHVDNGRPDRQGSGS